MEENSENTLICHLEALRKCLLWCIVMTATLYPLGYFLSSHVITFLVRWCFGENSGTLHYFAPMEVFWVRLRLALILSMVIAYPWNIRQVWIFFLPALYPDERRSLRLWLLLSSTLFFSGVAFCIFLILPLLMKFSQGFATPELRPIIGLDGFLSLSGWLMLSFGLMFQTPVAVLLAVHFGIISAEALKKKRPYVITGILVAAAILTPPDVISQAMLALPTWLLFELGLLLVKSNQKKEISQ